jgi:hypothetical protein
MDEKDAVAHARFQVSAVRANNLLQPCCFGFPAVELVDLKRPTAVNVGTALKLHGMRRFKSYRSITAGNFTVDCCGQCVAGNQDV